MSLALLNKQLGLTMRKTCRVARMLFGLELTPGGLSQALDRVADRLAGSYEALLQDIRAAPAVHADETSGWVGGPGWRLWTFTTPRETLYRVDGSRGPAVIARKLSYGNKTDRGRQTWQILASLAETCRQRGQDFVQWLSQRIRLQPYVG